MDEQKAQLTLEENSSLTKNEWLSFIRRQIDYEAERQKRLGISLWVICGSMLFIAERLLSNLYLIPSLQENTEATLNLVVLSFAAAICLLTQAVCIIQLYSRPKVLARTPGHGLFIALSSFITIVVPIYTVILIYLFVSGINEKQQVLLLINLLLTILWLRIVVVSKSTFKMFRKAPIISKITLFFVKHSRTLGSILVGFSFNCFAQLIIDIARLHSPRPEIEIALIFPIMIGLFMALVYILYSMNISNSYKDLENEIVLSCLNTDEILEILKKYFYGYSAVEWFDSELKEAESKSKIAYSLLNKDYSSIDYEQVLEYVVEMKDSVKSYVKYIDFSRKARLLTYIEENYYNKCIQKIHELIYSMEQIIQQIDEGINHTQQPIISNNIDSSD